MDSVLICVICGKIIAKDGKIVDGDAYHWECYQQISVDRRNEEISVLHSKYTDADFWYLSEDFSLMLEDLYMEYVDDGNNTLEWLYEEIEAKWAVITRGLANNGNGEIQIDTFTSKIKAAEWIADQIDTSILEGYAFNVEYILNKGKVFAKQDQINIKVSF